MNTNAPISKEVWHKQKFSQKMLLVFSRDKSLVKKLKDFAKR